MRPRERNSSRAVGLLEGACVKLVPVHIVLPMICAYHFSFQYTCVHALMFSLQHVHSLVLCFLLVLSVLACILQWFLQPQVSKLRAAFAIRAERKKAQKGEASAGGEIKSQVDSVAALKAALVEKALRENKKAK